MIGTTTLKEIIDMYGVDLTLREATVKLYLGNDKRDGLNIGRYIKSEQTILDGGFSAICFETDAGNYEYMYRRMCDSYMYTGDSDFDISYSRSRLVHIVKSNMIEEFAEWFRNGYLPGVTSKIKGVVLSYDEKVNRTKEETELSSLLSKYSYNTKISDIIFDMALSEIQSEQDRFNETDVEDGTESVVVDDEM